MRALSAGVGPTVSVEICGAEVTQCLGAHPDAQHPPACDCSSLHSSSPICHSCSCLDCQRLRREFRARLSRLGSVQLRFDFG
jgi:hypothetical protein